MIVAENDAQVSFSIDSRFRGLGMGYRIVRMTVERACDLLNVHTVRAEVFQSNQASQVVFLKRVFLKSGFELTEVCEINRVLSQVFIKKRS